MVHSSSDFFGSVGFPAIIDLCLRVNKLGNSSVVYEIGLFEQGAVEVKAVGQLVHVFVDREANRPVVNGIGEDLRKGIEKLLVRSQAKL